MPLYAQIICIGGNAILCVILLLAAGQGFSSGDFGLALFCFALACASGYTIWVLMKFKHYLGAEATLEREVHAEQLRNELAAEEAKHVAADKPAS